MKALSTIRKTLAALKKHVCAGDHEETAVETAVAVLSWVIHEDAPTPMTAVHNAWVKENELPRGLYVVKPDDGAPYLVEYDGEDFLLGGTKHDLPNNTDVCAVIE